ncbi:MAG: DUF86 domain-containing protein [Methanosarcinales archaeon]
MIEARIREINDAKDILKTALGKNYEELTIHENMSMRYLVVQLVEASAGICMHILSRAYTERAENYPDCFIRLGAKGIIPKDLEVSLVSAARLRNLLVHRYWEVDDKKVYNSVKNGLKDFEEYVVFIKKYLERRSEK